MRARYSPAPEQTLNLEATKKFIRYYIHQRDSYNPVPESLNTSKLSAEDQTIRALIGAAESFNGWTPKAVLTDSQKKVVAEAYYALLEEGLIHPDALSSCLFFEAIPPRNYCHFFNSLAFYIKTQPFSSVVQKFSAPGREDNEALTIEQRAYSFLYWFNYPNPTYDPKDRNYQNKLTDVLMVHQVLESRGASVGGGLYSKQAFFLNVNARTEPQDKALLDRFIALTKLDLYRLERLLQFLKTPIHASPEDNLNGLIEFRSCIKREYGAELEKAVHNFNINEAQVKRALFDTVDNSELSRIGQSPQFPTLLMNLINNSNEPAQKAIIVEKLLNRPTLARTISNYNLYQFIEMYLDHHPEGSTLTRLDTVVSFLKGRGQTIADLLDEPSLFILKPRLTKFMQLFLSLDKEKFTKTVEQMVLDFLKLPLLQSPETVKDSAFQELLTRLKRTMSQGNQPSNAISARTSVENMLSIIQSTFKAKQQIRCEPLEREESNKHGEELSLAIQQALKKQPSINLIAHLQNTPELFNRIAATDISQRGLGLIALIYILRNDAYQPDAEKAALEIRKFDQFLVEHCKLTVKSCLEMIDESYLNSSMQAFFQKSPIFQPTFNELNRVYSSQGNYGMLAFLRRLQVKESPESQTTPITQTRAPSQGLPPLVAQKPTIPSAKPKAAASAPIAPSKNDFEKQELTNVLRFLRDYNFGDNLKVVEGFANFSKSCLEIVSKIRDPLQKAQLVRKIAHNFDLFYKLDSSAQAQILVNYLESRNANKPEKALGQLHDLLDHQDHSFSWLFQDLKKEELESLLRAFLNLFRKLSADNHTSWSKEALVTCESKALEFNLDLKQEFSREIEKLKLLDSRKERIAISALPTMASYPMQPVQALNSQTDLRKTYLAPALVELGQRARVEPEGKLSASTLSSQKPQAKTPRLDLDAEFKRLLISYEKDCQRLSVNTADVEALERVFILYQRNEKLEHPVYSVNLNITANSVRAFLDACDELSPIPQKFAVQFLMDLAESQLIEFTANALVHYYSINKFDPQIFHKINQHLAKKGLTLDKLIEELSTTERKTSPSQEVGMDKLVKLLFIINQQSVLVMGVKPMPTTSQPAKREQSPGSCSSSLFYTAAELPEASAGNLATQASRPQ